MLGSAYAVILAGGRGKRFWPLSRAEKPKQFLSLAGGGTMVQNTVERIAPLIPPQRVLVVTGSRYGALVRDQLPQIPVENVLLEPEGRNTAAAVLWAASVVAERDPEGVMVVLSSDHHITNPEVFREAVGQAVQAARSHRSLVLFGLKPAAANPNYGYIIYDPAPVAPSIFRVSRFHEKPAQSQARDYLAGEACLWNSGMFAWRADVIAEQFRRHAAACQEACAEALRRQGDAKAFAEAYAGIPSISVDRAVLEHSERLLVVDTGIERVDLGNWDTVGGVLPADADGNTSVGDVIALGSRDSILHSSGKLIAAIGVEGLVVVAAGEVVLVCRRDRAPEVSALVDLVEKQHRGRA